MSQVELAQKVIAAYAEGLDGLSDDDCKALVKGGSGEDHIEAAQCQTLQDVLESGIGSLDLELYVKDAYIDHLEILTLVKSGFSSDFISALSGTDGKKALRARVKWLGEFCVKDYDVSAWEREAAIKQFMSARKDASGALPELRKAAVSDPHEKVRIAACEALGYIDAEGEETISVLIAALKDPHPRVQEAAADALGDAGEAAVPALIRALKKGDAGVREAAADSLGSIGSGAKAAIPVLIEALDDVSEDVRSSAIYALGYIGSKRAFLLIMRILKDSDEEVEMREVAAVALMVMDSKKSAAQLMRALRVGNRGARNSAAEAIKLMCQNMGNVEFVVDMDVFRLLARALMTNDAFVSNAVGDALAEISVEDHSNLIEVLKNGEDYERFAAASTLMAIGWDSDLPVLEVALVDPSEHVRNAAAVAIHEIKKRMARRRSIEL